ncbi:hypothetical protein PHYBLDRAFT_152171 [Phycomyces blakesleeanus NRRL 1555(-)]|uniref:Uncharacterized protein n=1 Tax=Phycomyces blakesleeanus (strain ATCC 8743b / DSM 1359 / FGSC 10004 / NBRC 33097 / NRRL 1555) TaxID=763407 RepID=A0A167JSN1_PHYB8|nr:hypothetical protein PHYBLDRAFT_152171 [Phycomyces blakesleeanus NRRL 1555(-)]OAD66626.1 hypothetical protein PHYBLDRAFT_152171 [Phycomyces blakesleeanus NRRL 1555(-)]|eukprot:XP_018284666.1 hypothetical protein PHYBLDRAFT_152171 [Phycomyces blakesleeanus NRRL 1555(-)]
MTHNVFYVMTLKMTNTHSEYVFVKKNWHQITTRFLDTSASLKFDCLLPLPYSPQSVKARNTTVPSYIVLGCTLGAKWEAAILGDGGNNTAQFKVTSSPMSG